ncbi:kinase-like domain-containing protein [Mycena amicta]|nr:kinase-like domain-containing protein [Mycena amicta]
MEAETKKGMRVAIKRINKRPAGRRRQKTKIKTAWTNLLAEVEIPLLMEGNSASLKVLGVWCDDGHFYVAMELAQLLEKELSPRNIYMYGRQLLCGVRALHRMGIIHLDIKPDNLLRTGGTLKIIDFGLSQRLNAVQPHFWAHHEGGYDRLQGPSGTPGFMSPLVQSSFYSFDADLWSAGVTLYQWMTKRDSPPEFEETTGVLSDFREDNFTDVQYDFFDRIFSTTPPHRFQTWEEVLGHKIWPELFSNRHSRTL